MEKISYKEFESYKYVDVIDVRNFLKPSGFISIENSIDCICYIKKNKRNTILVPVQKCTLIIDYPWKQPVSFEIETSNPSGFTLENIIEETEKCMIETYKEGNKGNLGDCYHGIGDLVLELINYRMNGEKHVIISAIGS